MSDDSLGRVAPDSNLPHDAPEATVGKILANQDRIIAALKGIAAKLDADATVTDTDYAALQTDSLAELVLGL